MSGLCSLSLSKLRIWKGKIKRLYGQEIFTRKEKGPMTFLPLLLVFLISACGRKGEEAELTKEQWERFRSQEDLSEGVWIHVNPEDVMLLK